MKEFKYSYSAKIVENGATISEGLKPALALTIPDVNESAVTFFDLASGTTDDERLLSPIDAAKFLIIEYDQDISIKLTDDANSSIALNAYGTPKSGTFMVMSSTVTAVYFSNSSGNVAKVKMYYGY